MSLEHRKRRHLEPEPEPEMSSADDEEFAAWVAGCFSSTAVAAEEASIFNTTAVVSQGQEDAQAQEHRKRRLDAVADAYTDEEFAAWIADPTFPDEALSQIFSDLPPLVEAFIQSKSNPVADADTDADTDGDIVALISDPTQLDEAWSKIFRLRDCSGLGEILFLLYYSLAQILCSSLYNYLFIYFYLNQ